MILHDPSDIFLEGAKMGNYAGTECACDRDVHNAAGHLVWAQACGASWHHHSQHLVSKLALHQLELELRFSQT